MLLLINYRWERFINQQQLTMDRSSVFSLTRLITHCLHHAVWMNWTVAFSDWRVWQPLCIVGVEVGFFSLPTCIENVFIINTPSARHYRNIYVQWSCAQDQLAVLILDSVVFGVCWALRAAVRYHPLQASLKETACEGRGRMLYNLSSFKGLYWYLVFTLGFHLFGGLGQN